MGPIVYTLFGTVFTIATAWGFGTLLLHRVTLPLDRLEKHLLAFVTGSACFSAVVFGLCVLGWARKGAYLIVGAMVIGAAIAFRAGRRPEESPTFFPGVWKRMIVVVFILAVAFSDALAPELIPSITTQHLSAIDRSHGLQQGAVLSDGTELLLLPAFAFGRHPAAQLVSTSSLIALALLMLCYGRRIGYSSTGVASAILVCALPAIGKLYSLPEPGAGTAAMLFALFYVLQLWAEKENAPALLVSAGILTGFSYATSYSAIVALPYAIGCITWARLHRRQPVFVLLFTVAILALAFIIPWAIQQHHVSLALLAWHASPYDWLFLFALLLLPALRVPSGRQLMLASLVFAVPFFFNPSPRVLAPAMPFALLAFGVALSATPSVLKRVASARLPALPSVPSACLRLAGAAFILAYFIYFAWDGLNALFTVDDPANLFFYWSRGAWPLIRAQFEFFSTYYRPAGGLFYLPIYSLVGFDPVVFRAVALSIILCNIAVFYFATRLATGSERIAWLAAFLVTYPPHLIDIVYENGKIYDVLCFLFYFAALAWYLRIRVRGQFCNWRQTVVFLALYICALNSKEMAVTLPVTLALFELLFHPPSSLSMKSMWPWLKREGRMTAIAALVTALYLVGKILGQDPLIQMEGYRPEFTAQKFLNTVASNIREIFDLPDWFGPPYMIAAWIALLAFAWLKKNKYVAFCVLFAISSELPIAFIGRSWSCLYIPLAAWAMLVAAAVGETAAVVASVFRNRTERFLIVTLLIAAFVFFNLRLAWNQKQAVRHFFFETQAPVWSAMQQFDRFEISPKRGDKLAFLHDPLAYPTTLFLARLRFRNPNLDIWLTPTTMTAEQLSTMDYVFDYREGKFVQLK